MKKSEIRKIIQEEIQRINEAHVDYSEKYKGIPIDLKWFYDKWTIDRYNGKEQMPREQLDKIGKEFVQKLGKLIDELEKKSKLNVQEIEIYIKH